MKKWILAIAAVLGLSQAAQAADSKPVEWLRGEGKFNVVATVLTVIFAGIVLWLFVQDRKLSKLEKEIKNKNNEN